MSCEFNDLLVINMAFDWYANLSIAPAGSMTPEELAEMEEIGVMLEEIGQPSVGEQIHAIHEAVKEIKDRGQ